MKKLFFLVLFLFLSGACVIAQIPEGEGPLNENEGEGGPGGGLSRKFSEKKEKQKRAPIDLYKIISVERDTTFLDTTLSIQKEYKFNYLRRDDFELQPQLNIGRPYTQLAKQISSFNVIPQFGATIRHFGYLEIEDINYYQVPTPLTELYYKTASQQGQQLDAFISLNPSKNLNLSVGYKGVRSLGEYQSSLTSTKAFRGMLSYNLPNNKYVANLHFTDQRLLNQENGGFSAAGLESFLGLSDNDQDIGDRAVIDVNFEDTENLLNGKRLYLNHEYRIAKPDSTGISALALNHEFHYTSKKWSFTQEDTNEDFFGAAQTEDEFTDRVILNLIQNKVQVNLQNATLGKLGLFARHSFYNYGYNTVFAEAIIDETTGNPTGFFERAVTNRLRGELISLGANYKNTYKGFLLEGNAESTISGDYTNQYFQGTAGFNYKDKIDLKLGYELKSEAVGFNKQLYQSNYVDYNYQNSFDNVVTNTLFGSLFFNKNFWVKGALSLISNYSYFEGVPPTADPNEILDEEELEDVDEEEEEFFVSEARQDDGLIGVLKITAFKEFALGNLRLANTLLFQQVQGDDNDVYNVPQLVTRNSLYYQAEVFKRAMLLQTGFNFKYFTKFYADGYDPLLAENYVQNRQEIGGYTQLDFFINTKVKQTRIFFKLENFQGLIQENTDLVAPNYGSRDFSIRFGMVWNFFL